MSFALGDIVPAANDGSTTCYVDWKQSVFPHIILTWKRYEGTTVNATRTYTLNVDDPDAYQALITLLMFCDATYDAAGDMRSTPIPSVLGTYVASTSVNKNKWWTGYP